MVERAMSAMLTFVQYCEQYPNHAFDFTRPIVYQARIIDPAQLAVLPDELLPVGPYIKGGRSRPNRNQTKTHKQCGKCQRVLRNDFYWASPALLKDNMVTTYCKECAKIQNLERYGESGDLMRVRRLAIWRYISPRCTICGFDKHPAAIDMHHLMAKDELIPKLVAQLAATPSPRNARRLIAEATKCVALCSNCHRLLHANVLSLPADSAPPEYLQEELIQLIHDAGDDLEAWQPELL